MASQLNSRLQQGFEESLSLLAAERPGEDLLYAAPSSNGRTPATPSAARPLSSHRTDGVEFGLSQRGAALVVTPGGIFRLTPGKLLVIDRQVPHAELPGYSNRAHTICWLHLTENRVILANSTYSPRRGLVSPDVHLSGPTDVERIGESVCLELAARGTGYHRAVFGLLTYLSCLLQRRLRRGEVVASDTLEAPAPTGDRRTWLAIQAALAYCESNFRKGISRTDVAKAVGYSPAHLGHLVSTHLGHSLSQHLSDLRINEAKRLLEESGLSVREIAAHVGYADPAHFTRAFSRATGSSPIAYRRRAEVL